MPGTTAHRQPAGADAAGPLSAAEVVDTADTSPRAPAPDLSGKRVRAIPYAGGTTVEVTSKDFRDNGIKHPTIVFDFRRDNFTLPVDPKPGQKGLSKEAADFLTREHGHQFEYMSS